MAGSYTSSYLKFPPSDTCVPSSRGWEACFLLRRAHARKRELISSYKETRSKSHYRENATIAGLISAKATSRPIIGSFGCDRRFSGYGAKKFVWKLVWKQGENSIAPEARTVSMFILTDSGFAYTLHFHEFKFMSNLCTTISATGWIPGGFGGNLFTTFRDEFFEE